MADKGLNFRLGAIYNGAPAFNRLNRDMSAVRTNVRAAQPLMRSWNAGLNSNRRAVQQFGFQMSDFAIQIAGGQSAMLAFTQQGGQMLQFFGPAGALMAAFLAVFGSLAIAFTRSGKSLADLFPLMGVLQDEFRGLGEAIVVVRDILIDVTNVIVNNLDTILIAAALVAGYFAAQWVSSVVIAMVTTGALSNVLRATALSFQLAGVGTAAATLGTSALAGAMALLRTALLRLGIPALIIGLAYLIERFLAMSNVVGGVGEMFKLLGDLVAEVFDRMLTLQLATVVSMVGAYQNLKAMVIGVFADILDFILSDFVNRLIGVHIGAFNAIVAVFEALPAVFARIGAQAMNALVDSIQVGINGVLSAISAVKEAVGLDAIPPIDLGQWKSEVGEVVDVVGAAGAAFDAALGQDFTGGMTDGLREIQAEAEASGKSWSDLGDILRQAATSPLGSWEKLLDVWNRAKESQVDIRDWFSGGTGEGDSEGGGGRGAGGARGAAEEAAKDIETIFESMQKRIGQSILAGFKAVLSGAKTLGEAARDILSSIIDMIVDILTTPIINGIAGRIAGGIAGTFGLDPSGPVPSFGKTAVAKGTSAVLGADAAFKRVESSPQPQVPATQKFEMPEIHVRSEPGIIVEKARQEAMKVTKAYDGELPRTLMLRRMNPRRLGNG